MQLVLVSFTVIMKTKTKNKKGRKGRKLSSMKVANVQLVMVSFSIITKTRRKKRKRRKKEESYTAGRSPKCS